MLRWILHRLKGDKVIWITVILIALSSLLAIYSASSGRAFRLHGGDTTYPVIRHAMHLLVGIGVMFLVHLVNYRIYARITNALLFITLALLIYTIAQGSDFNDAARWITIFGQSFQPSDLAKITLMIYLAKLLTQRQEVIKDFTEGFLPALFWVTVICGLIAPEDLSTAALMFISSLMVMFVAGVELKYLGVLAMVAMMGLAILTKTAKRSSTWKARWSDYVERWTEPDYEGDFHTAEAHTAIATGGLLGKGVGKSSHRNFLPSASADSVYAIVIEEYGLVGGGVVIALYLLLLLRSVSIVTMSKTFGALLACGLSFMLVLQAMMNMGVTVGLLPITGLPLPLISMGGTSILTTCLSIGIILGVSRDAMEQAGPKPKKVALAAA